MSNPREWLTQLRQQKYPLQKDAAEALGVSKPILSQWESGARRPSYAKILRLSDMLGPEVLKNFEAETRGVA